MIMEAGTSVGLKITICSVMGLSKAVNWFESDI